VFLQKASGFGVETPQKLRIGPHLVFQHQGRQVAGLLLSQKHPVGPMLQGLEHRRQEAVAARSGRRQIR
jgi:hypothetical protein